MKSLIKKPLISGLQFITVILTCVFIFQNRGLSAEQAAASSKILFKIIDSPFAPERGYFFIKYDNGNISMLPAEFYSLDAGSQGDGAESYVFGSIIDNNDIQPKARISLALISGDGKATVTEEDPLSDNLNRNDQGDSLRIGIKDIGIEIKSLEDKRKHLDDELRRLRADIDLLSGSGRLKDLDKEIKRTTDELEALKRDAVFLKQLLTSVKTVREPRSFQQRESDLLRMISKLTAENAKLNREDNGDSAQINVDRKKMLADIGRTANIPALTKELEALRKRRMELEEERAGDVLELE